MLMNLKVNGVTFILMIHVSPILTALAPELILLVNLVLLLLDTLAAEKG
jgi:hypothetical protein